MVAASDDLRAQLLGLMQPAKMDARQSTSTSGAPTVSTPNGQVAQAAAAGTGGAGGGSRMKLSDLLRRTGGEAAVASRLRSLAVKFTAGHGLRIAAEVDFRVSPFALLLGMHAPPPSTR